jgi:AraC-like DNA-binding protein
MSFEVDSGTEFFDALCKMSKKSLPIPEDVTDSLDFITRRVNSKADYNDVIIKNRLYEIIALIADCHSSKNRSGFHSDSDLRLERAKQYIDDNPHTFFICDEVAYYCHLSTKQLGRLFKENEGCSLLQYIHKKKIDLAKQMIRESDGTFDKISSSLGFSSVNYFGKFFTRHTGMTPGEYRHITEKPENAASHEK